MKLTIRKEGTKVFTTETDLDKIQALREIVTDSQYAVVNGQAVDLFSASAVVSVYDALNEVNKGKYLKLAVYKMADIAFKLLNKQEAA